MSISFALIDNNGTLQESYGPPLPIYSITKTVIAWLILDLKINIHDPISKWVTKDECIHHADIQVIHLLNHSSGLTNYGALQQYKEDVEQRKEPWTDAHFASQTTHQPLLFEPGKSFSYSNPGYWLLKRILEKETALSLADIVQTHIAKPMGLSSMAVIEGDVDESIPHYKAGWVWHGLLKATAEDVAKFIHSEKISQQNSHTIKVAYQDAYWQDPYYGMGLMSEPATKYGHMGGGPGFETACMHSLITGKTGCALVSADEPIRPMDMVLKAIE